MESVIVRFREYFSSASDSEKEVIKYVLENMERAAGINIHELAHDSFVSAATVTRLCKKVGFKNYKSAAACL